MRRRSMIAGLALPILVVLLFSVPPGAGSVSLGPSVPAAPLGVAHVAAAASAAPAGSPSASPIGLTSVTVCPPPPYPTQGYVNGVFPPSPTEGLQMPCPPISQDETHVTFSSNAAGSGERWTIPVTLAPGTANGTPTDHFVQEEVGIIVKGDVFSQWGQSYAEVVFVPEGSGNSTQYVASLHIFALETQSISSATNGLLFTWNDTWEWLADYANATETTGFTVPGGDTVDVTFAGSANGSAGMLVWANDTTTPSISAAYVLNKTDLGGPYNFTPFYSTACNDNCILHWAYDWGQGVGFTNCPFDAISTDPCNSYNQGFWSSSPSPSFGRPEFWQSGGYRGDFYFFAPESISGICNTLAPTNTVANCFSFDIYNGQGYYPYYTFTATGFEYGTNGPSTLENLGGYSFEYPASGSARDLVPEFFYQAVNDSRAGYAASGSAVGIRAEMLDLGTVGYVNLTYSINGGAMTTVPLAFTNGSRSFGNWTASIPSGPDGVINYTISSKNNASATVTTPSVGAFRVVRGPLPTFNLTLLTEDPSCASISVNGTSYSNGTLVRSLPGFYSLRANGCYPWVFAGWKTVSGGATATDPASLSTTLELSASGVLEALWSYIRPLDTVTLQTSPLCGQVVLNGTPYSTGQSVQLLDAGNYSIGHVGCANEAFRGWTFSTTTGSWKILGNYLTIFGNGTLTANYVPSGTASALVFQTNPSSCGGVLFYGAGYTSNESVSVSPGGYPIGPDPCSHFGFLNFTFSGQGTVAANESWLTVTGGGTLTENNYVLTEVTFIINPSSCGPASWDGQNVTNGETVVVSNGSTHSIYGRTCPGHYLIAITGTGGVNAVGNLVTVTGSGDLDLAYGAGNASQFLGFLTDPSTCGGILEGGTEYTDSQYTYLAPGTVATVTPVPCAGYGFLQWITFGLVSIVGTTAYFNGSGALEAVFRPLTGILIFTSPTGCGSVSVGGTVYPGNSTVSVTEGVQYPVQAIPCAGDAFVQWINSSGAELSFGPYDATNTVSALAESILTAEFAPIRFTVQVLVNPPSCGAVRISGAQYINGSSLTVPIGVYPITPNPCTGDHLVRWAVTGNVSVAGSNLYVNSSGSVAAFYLPVPPSVSLTVANSSLAGDSVLVSATVAVPIPPFNYNYTWSFGDGSAPVTTPVNFTSHTFANPGRYNVTVVVTDPINRTANASALILIVAASPLSSNFFTPLSLAAIALVLIVALLAIAVVLVGRRPRAPVEEEGPTLAVAPAETLEPLPSPSETGSSTGEESKP